MTRSNRVFVSFAVEDTRLRDLLVGQARNASTPFSLVDMSVKEPWDSEWKTRCRTKIRGCDGVLGLVTSSTTRAAGQLWELKCAYEEGVPVLLLYGYQDDRPARLPDPVAGRRILTWSWSNIASFLESL